MKDTAAMAPVAGGVAMNPETELEPGTPNPK